MGNFKSSFMMKSPLNVEPSFKKTDKKNSNLNTLEKLAMPVLGILAGNWHPKIKKANEAKVREMYAEANRSSGGQGSAAPNMLGDLDNSGDLSNWEQARQDKINENSSPGKMVSPFNAGCSKSEGGPGCIQKRGGEWVIINNKKPGNKIFQGGFSSKAEAEKSLRGYQANK